MYSNKEKTFKGTATIISSNGVPYKKKGTWTYKPDEDFWYCQQDDETPVKYPPEILEDFQED